MLHTIHSTRATSSFLRTTLAAAALCGLLVLPPPSAAQAANKPMVGIAEIDTSLRHADVVAFRAMVETAIITSGRFGVYERDRLETILKEQAMGEHGVTDSGGEVGGLGGVDYLIYGTITQLGEKKQGFGLDRFGASKSTVTMAVDLRITDVQTGEIRYAGAVERSVDSSKGAQIGGLTTGQGGDASSALGEVQRAVAKSIAAAMVTTIYPVKVVSVQNDTVFLNYGSSILSKDDYLKVASQGEEIIDPDTGISLGNTEQQIGVIQVTEVTGKFSKATVVEGDIADLKSGHIARPMSAPPKKRKRKGKRI